MPIFEYACRNCGREFEKLVRSANPAIACPACHGTELTKKLSTFAAVTSSAAASFSDAPAGCGSCGHPGGSGACQFD